MRAAARRGGAAALLFVCAAAGATDRTVSAKFMPIGDAAQMARFLQGMSAVFAPTQVKASDTLEDALRAHCGFIDRKMYLLDRARALSGSAAAATGERILTLPPCPYWVFDTEVSVPQGATTEQLDAKLHALLGYPYQNKTKAAIDARNPGRNVLALAMAGEPFKVPYITRPATYVVAAQLDPQTAVADLEKNNPAAVIREPGSETSVNSGGEARFGLVIPTNANDSNDSKCAPGAATSAPPDMTLLAEIVQRNSPQAPAKKVKVLVIDTGIDEPTLKDYLADTRGDPHYPASTYGIQASSRRGPPTPLPDYPLKAHGTNVAALVLGGLADAHSVDFARPRIEVEAVQVVTRIATPQQQIDYVISGAEVTTGFVYAQGNAQHSAPSVVNLSIEGNEGMYSDLRGAVIGTSSVIVAAAGNQGWNEAAGLATPFPISYKDYAKDRMIVVGAFDPSDPRRGPAKFSNIGANWVDILAAGCKVDTLDPGATRVARSGTSFAAPKVAFAAAVLTSMGMLPPDVKGRIIGASEFDEALATSAFSSGRFDLLRTLDLAQSMLRTLEPDATQPSAAPTEVARTGEFDLLSDAAHPCADESTNPQAKPVPLLVGLPRGRLVKIVGFRTGTSAAKLRFYHYALEDQRDVQFKECKASDATFTFDPEGAAMRWRDLVEYVPRFIN